jgi:hypothetical protein
VDRIDLNDKVRNETKFKKKYWKAGIVGRERKKKEREKGKNTEERQNKEV